MRQLGEMVRIATDDDRLVRFTAVHRVEFQNPLKVVDDCGRVLGTAVATLVGDWLLNDYGDIQAIPSDAIHLDFLLDKNTPEGFDAEVDLRRVQVRLLLQITDGVIGGTIQLSSR